MINIPSSASGRISKNLTHGKQGSNVSPSSEKEMNVQTPSIPPVLPEGGKQQINQTQMVSSQQKADVTSGRTSKNVTSGRQRRKVAPPTEREINLQAPIVSSVSPECSNQQDQSGTDA